MSLPIEELTPTQIVAELDRTIVGQKAAKRAVAVALRSRWRRQQLPESERLEVMPKNILMIGPTGVGKTEIARRLARLARAPFVKVEATKFTEVGYVGRDVESMVRELAAVAVRLVEQEKAEAVREESRDAALNAAAQMILGQERPNLVYGWQWNPADDEGQTPVEPEESEEGYEEALARIRTEIEQGIHDERMISIDVEEQSSPFMQVFTPQGMEEMGIDMAGNNPFGGSRTVSREVPVKIALPVLEETEAKRRISRTSIYREAVERAEQTGIIFLDEIDKIAMRSGGSGPEVSREGVQRDLLPIIEGSVVPSKFGPIRTDHILFIAAGAFHESKPSDLIPELQGRLPVRVELESLSEADFRRILTEPENSLVRQYTQLLRVDGIEVRFSDDALDEVAHMAEEVNKNTENIGARRLHTMLERLLEDLMFAAPEAGPKTVEFTCAEVREVLGPIVRNAIKSKTIL
ncbi:MAG: ATP-dependent protease ATPase subunit HslU [Fimbriimonadaceae bacterium]|nr:ATP-dependent protease ATPase subunit HslU [Fimbriimonadaceae bacterium]